MSCCVVGWQELPNMCGIVLVIASAVQPNGMYPSPISGRAEHQSLNTYETVTLCK